MIFILFCLLFPCNNNNVCETDFVSINYVTKNIKYRKKKRNKNVKISLTLIQVQVTIILSTTTGIFCVTNARNCSHKFEEHKTTIFK